MNISSSQFGLSKWANMSVTLMTVPITGHVILLPLLLTVCGRDTWLAGLVSLPIGLTVLLLIYYIKRKHATSVPEPNSPIVLYRGFGKPLSLLISGYLLFVAVLSTASLLDLLHICFMPDTPLWALGGWFFLIYWYGARKGVHTLVLTTAALTILSLITGHTITLIASPMKEWGNLKPILEFGWSPVWYGVFIITSIWPEFAVLLFLPLQKDQSKRLYAVWSLGVLGNTAMILSTVTGAIAIFGYGQAQNFTYPALETVRLMSLGFIDRFDIYGLILMAFGCYIRSALYLTIATEWFMSMWRPKHARLRVVPEAGMGLAIYIGAEIIARDYWRLSQFTNYYIYVGLLMLFVLFLFFISSVLNSKGRVPVTS